MGVHMCQEISAKMLERLRSPVCKPNGLAWPNFQTLAKTMDCSGMWDYFNDCLRKWPDVDADWKSRGGIPFSDVREEMEALYRQHPAQGGRDDDPRGRDPDGASPR